MTAHLHAIACITPIFVVHKDEKINIMEFKDLRKHASFRKSGVRENEASKTRQWFFVMVVFGGLLALGSLAFLEYDSIWVNAMSWSPKGYWTGGRTTRLFQVKESSSWEPWGQVSYFHSLPRELLDSRILVSAVTTGGLSMRRQADRALRSCQEENSYTKNALTFSIVPDLMFQWTGIAPTQMVLVSA